MGRLEKKIMSVMIRDVGGVKGGDEAFKVPGPDTARASCAVAVWVPARMCQLCSGTVGTWWDVMGILSSYSNPYPLPEPGKCQAELE